MGLGLEGIGVPLIAAAPSESWATFGWVCAVLGAVALIGAAVVAARRRTDTPGAGTQAIAQATGAGSVSGNVIQNSTVTVTTGAHGERSTRDVVKVTPEYLLGLFRQHTSIQAQRLIQPFLGQRMRVSGVIGDVSATSNFVSLVFGTDGHLDPRLRMYFDLEWADRLAVLPRGTQLTVVGRIDEVSKGGLELEDCELEDPEGS